MMTMSIKTHHELWPSSGRSLMYSKKRVRPRMEAWWTQALTGYSCKDFPFRATQSRLLLRKDEISSINLPETLQDSSLWRRPACQTWSKSFDVSGTTVIVVPVLSKPLVILLDITIERTAVDREDLNPYWKLGKWTFYSRLSKSLYL